MTNEIKKAMTDAQGQKADHLHHVIHEFDLLQEVLLHKRNAAAILNSSENAYSIVKCVCRDNIFKPKTVMDIKLAVNILDTELKSPIFHYQTTVEYLIKDLLSHHLSTCLDKEISQVNEQRSREGLEALSKSEIIFKKIRKVLDLTDDNAEDPASKRYAAVSKELMDSIVNVRAESDPETFDQLAIRENIKRIIDDENIRNHGFNTAVNLLTSILHDCNMEYEYMENMKNSREILLREYDDTQSAHLPDEHYQIRLRYYNTTQLTEERKAYGVMVRSFETEVAHLWNVVNAQYDKSKVMTRITDFFDLAKLYEKYIQRKYNIPKGEPSYKDSEKIWDEVSFIAPAETEVEKMNRTFVFEKERIHKKMSMIQEKIKKMYNLQYPVERRVLEERLDFLKSEFNKFDTMINPFHVQPGLLLDIDMTSIKHKKATFNSIAQVVNEFLHAVSKGFQEPNVSPSTQVRSKPLKNQDANHFTNDEDTRFSATDVHAVGQASLNPFIALLNEAVRLHSPNAETSTVREPASSGAGSGQKETAEAAASKGQHG